MDTDRTAEQIARHAYGRLVAYLAVRTRDVATAEDALSDAFLKALKTWPSRGIPDNPEAWLLVTARRRLIDNARRTQTHSKALTLLNEEGFTIAFEPALSGPTFPDERLKLLFICAHPAIDAKLHTPLMLQTVLGLNAAQIGSAFLVAPTTMGQRLVRVKSKIKDAGIPFELPSPADLSARSQAVLQAIYTAYTHGWESSHEATTTSHPYNNLATEAIWLAKLCIQLLPHEPEAQGLLALMLYCESRKNARYSATGAFIPLSEQNTSQWSQALIQEAEHVLKQASTHQSMGRFQLEAAIQSVHTQRATTQRTDWATLKQLYEGLIAQSPTIGANLGYVCALSHVYTPAVALNHLNALPTKLSQNHQPYWAIKAHLLKQLGQTQAAQAAYTRAKGLTQNPALSQFLSEQCP